MKGLKNLAIFLAGGITAACILEKGFEMDTKHPREGSIIFENDEIRVIRATCKPSTCGWDLATVVHKNKTEV